MKIPFLKEVHKVSSASDIIDNLTEEYKQEKRECFGLVTLDTKNKIIRNEIISIGTLNASLVHPREVFRPAIKDSACSIILVHNHPSGDPEPSEEDLDVTNKLKEAGKIIGIDVLDSLIYGKDGYKSLMREN